MELKMYEDISWTPVSEKRNNLTKSYEPIQPYFLVRMAKELEEITFFDVGANIGVYSLIMGTQSNVEQVYAFEPMRECVEEIRSNISMNDLNDKIDIFPLALSNLSGEVNFRKISNFSGSSGVVDTQLFSDLKFESDQKIESKRLDDISFISGKNIIIKIDVEGHEYNVLKGAQKVLTNNNGFMQIEIHESNPDYNNTIKFLKSIGWKKVIRVGWDYYFSNIQKYTEDDFRMEFTESLLKDFVDQSLNESRPFRRAIGKGFTVELSRKNANRIKKLLPSWLIRR